MKSIIAILISSLCFFAQAQSEFRGIVTSKDEPVPFAKVHILDLGLKVLADENGEFVFQHLPDGKYTIQINSIGYQSHSFKIIQPSNKIKFEIDEIQNIDEMVVTGTRTDKRRTDSPVIVGVINSKTLENVQACTLSDGLKFQPGLRVETDCQTCNYTQLRMNGLAGGYSQILINGRPIFSPLTGLYGLEQIPVNMIEKIEVVRGGGSALFGSSAIGGTVNVITKIPKNNSFSISNNFQYINDQTADNIISGNATFVAKSKKTGVSLFFNQRNRGLYDHNDDSYSELPSLKNTSFGMNLFVRPAENQKIELNLSNLNEFRYGGERNTTAPAHFSQQSEERKHTVFMGSLDYQINFNDDKSSIIAYTSGQYTLRDHYTGIIPDDSTELANHFITPPYGESVVSTIQGGIQYNQLINPFIKGENVLTLGLEWVEDKVKDEIPAYNYYIDQTTQNIGAFAQTDWEIIHDLTLLLGVRADKHNLLDKIIVSPRISFLYKLKENTQFRLTWGQGFRAPQAFDTDLHIAFAGGGVSRVTLSDDLIQERSNSISASINYDKAYQKLIAGFTLEGFHTILNNAFYLHPLGEDEFGEVFEKRNGDGAEVSGISLELRANYKKKIELESGITIQSSLFNTAVSYSDELADTRDFLRTPNQYGFATLFYTPTKSINASLNAVYTGPMKILHLAGAPEQLVDEYYSSPSFVEFNIKLAYNLNVKSIKSNLEVFTGIKNLLNAYQDNFDTGKMRDSNFIYGPALPRTIFVGIKISSIR